MELKSWERERKKLEIDAAKRVKWTNMWTVVAAAAPSTVAPATSMNKPSESEEAAAVSSVAVHLSMFQSLPLTHPKNRVFSISLCRMSSRKFWMKLETSWWWWTSQPSGVAPAKWWPQFLLYVMLNLKSPYLFIVLAYCLMSFCMSKIHENLKFHSVPHTLQ